MAGVLFALVVSYASDARAGERVSDATNEVFVSGTSFENLAAGAFDPRRGDAGENYAPFYWFADPTNDAGQVVQYRSGEAYDYAARGTRRNAYLAEVEPTAKSYLHVTADQGLHRSAFGRDRPYDAFSNLVVRTGCRDSVYCDMLTQFSVSDESPTLTNGERLVVWLRIRESDDGTSAETNLMVTAGSFTNTFKSAFARDYRLDLSGVCPGGVELSRWYRLTIRALGDVSAKTGGGEGLSGFTVSIDGQAVACAADEYAICPSEDEKMLANWFRPEARALIAARRFFPTLAAPHGDAAFRISGLTFAGDGKVDDVTISSEDPGFDRRETVFTLTWDDGIASLRYSLDGGLTTNDAPVASTARALDIPLGNAATNGLVLKVVSCAYVAEGNFTNGVWAGANGVTLTNATCATGEFAYDGTNANPIAKVVSSRNALQIGGKGGYRTFKSAFAALDGGTTNVLELGGDVTVGTKADGYGNNDEGYVRASNVRGEYVLDLKGHTLRGQSAQHPTLVVNCRSFRVIDTSPEKTGCIRPVGDITDADPRRNTAVDVYPQVTGDGQETVEPTVTLSGGTYDGWVRNDGIAGAERAVAGTVFVEGGRYRSTNELSFYLDARSCVTNPLVQYVYRAGYWIARTETNLVIWTGGGDGRRWADPANWKVGRVPLTNEIALFPSRASGEAPWTVDVETNLMTTKSLALEGDVFLSGTNDFRGVAFAGEGLGRLCGDATLVFEGEQPGSLAAMLRDDWAGTVLLRNVGYPATKAPTVLKHLETWGTAHSTVVFHGVRGYVMDVNSHTVPYAFVLRDFVDGSVTNAAWQNDSGYTGSTLAFTGALSGDGTFQSGANVRPILQLFKFADVLDFRGRFVVNGKRVLIGSETLLSSKPGQIAFGNQAALRSNLRWTCRHAVFGAALNVWGGTNDVLVTCTESEPNVASCGTLSLNGYTGVAWLACTNEPKWTVYVSGERPASKPAAASLARAVLASSAASSSDDGGYSAAALRVSALAMATVAVNDADVSIGLTDDRVAVTVGNTSAGLWYGVRHRASLADPWQAPAYWVRATGTSVAFDLPKTDEAGFYGVVVTIDDPSAGGGDE